MSLDHVRCPHHGTVEAHVDGGCSDESHDRTCTVCKDPHRRNSDVCEGCGERDVWQAQFWRGMVNHQFSANLVAELVRALMDIDDRDEAFGYAQQWLDDRGVTHRGF